MKAVAVRDARSTDMAAIAAIYGHHVRTGFGSFEEEAPGPEELERRRGEILAKGLPYLVAEGSGGAVLGYAYASPYRTRSAYRFTVENSIYVAPARTRGGIGRALIAALILRCTALGYRHMIAVIGDTGNEASIGLHRAMGFERAGLLRAVGYKRGRWIDCVLMQRTLGEGDATPPKERGEKPTS